MSTMRFAEGQLACRQLGDFRRTSDEPVQTYPEGRRCACGWKLSIYNMGTDCTRCETKPVRGVKRERVLARKPR